MVSGGKDAKLRVWHVWDTHQVMEKSIKEHKATINCVQLIGTQCVSGASDGSSIVRDLVE